MLVSNLCHSEHQVTYLVTESHFEEAKFQWRVTSDVPLKLSVEVAGGLIIVTKERQMWYTDTDGNDNFLWLFIFYMKDDEIPIFWFSKNGDGIGELEIEHLNTNLIKRIGEIEWIQLKK